MKENVLPHCGEISIIWITMGSRYLLSDPINIFQLILEFFDIKQQKETFLNETNLLCCDTRMHPYKLLNLIIVVYKHYEIGKKSDEIHNLIRLAYEHAKAVRQRIRFAMPELIF